MHTEQVETLLETLEGELAGAVDGGMGAELTTHEVEQVDALQAVGADGAAVGGGVGTHGGGKGEGRGNADAGIAVARDIGFVALGGDGKEGAVEVDGVVDRQGGMAVGVGKGGRDEGEVGAVDESDIGVWRHRDLDAGGDAVKRRRHVGGGAEPRQERGVAHELVDFPIVDFGLGVAQLAGGGRVDSHIARDEHAAGGDGEEGAGLVVGVEEAVVHAQIVGVVRHVHGVADVITDADAPEEILGPVGGIGGAEVGDGAGIVATAEEGFAEADTHVELVGEAAVAYHNGGHAGVGHGIGVGDRQRGAVPAVPVAMGAVVDQAHAVVVEIAQGVGGAADGGAAGDDNAIGVVRDVVLVVGHGVEAVVAVDVGGGDVVHGGVAVAVGVVGGRALVDAGDEGGTRKVAVVGKAVGLVEDGLVDDVGEGCGVDGGEAAGVAVGQAVAGSPGGEIEVGDMVVGDVPRRGGYPGVKGRQLGVVADEEQEGGRRGVDGGVVIEILEVVGNGGIVAEALLVHVDEVDEHALTAFPVGEGGEDHAAQAAGGDDDHAEGCLGADVLGGEETVEGLARRESGRMVAVVVFEGALDVGVGVVHRDGGTTADDDLAGDGVDTHGAEDDAGQPAVAGDAFHFDPRRGHAPKLVGGIALGVDDGRRLVELRLGAAGLQGIEVGEAEVERVVDSIGDHHRDGLAERNGDDVGLDGNGGRPIFAAGDIALEVKDRCFAVVEGGCVGCELGCLIADFQTVEIVGCNNLCLDEGANGECHGNGHESLFHFYYILNIFSILGHGASMAMCSWVTGCSKATLWAWSEMLPSSLLRGAPYLRSPLMGHPILANWQRI